MYVSPTTTVGVVKLGVPSLNTVAGPLNISVAETWMFVADDGHPDGPALFGANGKGEIYTARLTSPLDDTTWGSVSWSLLASSDVQDMWHVYHNTVHWISYNTKAGGNLLLTILDRDLKEVLAPTEIVVPSGAPAVPKGGFALNDHFLVGLMGSGTSPGGKVGVGVTDTTVQRTTIIVVSKSGAIDPSTYELDATIANGSSADQELEVSTLRGRLVSRVFASSSLSGTEDSTVTQLDFDRAWGPAPSASNVLLAAGGVNYSMATELTLGSFGRRLVTYRKITPLYETEEEGDLGNICRQWFGVGAAGMGEQVLVGDGKAARPHTATWRDPATGKSYVMTCWSRKDGKVEQYLQVDEIVA